MRTTRHHTPLTDGSVRDRDGLLVPLDLAATRRFETHFRHLRHVLPVPRHDILDKARVGREVADLGSDILDGSVADLALRLVEVDGVFAVGLPDCENTVGQLHDFGNAEGCVRIPAALVLVSLDSLDEFLTRHVLPPWGVMMLSTNLCSGLADNIGLQTEPLDTVHTI